MTMDGKPEATERRELDVPRLVMRVRRLGDLSQRDLAGLVGISQPQIARIERSLRELDVRTLERVLDLAGLRLAVVDGDGNEVSPVSDDVILDHAGRRMPAHLDVRVPTDRPRRLLTDTRYDRPEPNGWYHHRDQRDLRRRELGLTAHTDQPTRADAEREYRRRLERHPHQATPGRSARVELDECGCPAACWGTKGCEDACTCRCGG